MRLITIIISVSAFAASGCSAIEGAVADTQPATAASNTRMFPDPSVTYLQQALTDLGYEVGPVDGFYGPATSDAVADFQTDQGMEPTGAVDVDTAVALAEQNNETELLLVLAIQTQLTELGFYSGAIDGVFGPETIAAVASLQEVYGIAATGEFDGPTFESMIEAYDREVIQASLEAASAAGIGGDIRGGRRVIPEGSEDEYLQQGETGDRVLQLQQRLTELGYRPGSADGKFGAQTASAVLAFQKREGLQRDAIVGPEVLGRLEAPQGAGPKSDAPGPRVEIDLDRQLLFAIGADGSVTTINTSTGSGREFQSADPGKGIAVAHTPVGEFQILRVIDGLRQAPLGTLYRPMYFTDAGGFAIHGNPNVPAYPASHGCVRVANIDMDFLWDLALAVGNPVWVYGSNPPAPDNADGGF